MMDQAGIRDHLSQALAELRISHTAQGQAITALEASLQQGLNALPEAALPLSEPCHAHREGITPKIDNDPTKWRAMHRFGNPSKLDTDSELRAFILHRVETLTYDQIVEAVAAAFPPDRRTSQSALSRWFRRQNPPRTGASTT